jgi:hypothetical protein
MCACVLAGGWVGSGSLPAVLERYMTVKQHASKHLIKRKTSSSQHKFVHFKPVAAGVGSNAIRKQQTLV